MEEQNEVSKKNYACPYAGCTSVFNRPYRLAQHRLVHINVKPFACALPNCEKAYTSKSHLDRHVNSVHTQSELEILYWSLTFCIAASWPCFRFIKEPGCSIARVTGCYLRDCSCPKCMKKYSNRQNLKRHIKMSHAGSKKLFTCNECKIQFKKKEQLVSHMYQHNGVKAYKCPLCSKDFITKYKRKKHMRNHKTHRCEHCDTTFIHWTDLMAHKRVDHASPEYICNDCGKVFKERSHIIRHVKKHMPGNSVTVFFCPYDNCHRHYSRNSNLKQHILVKHEGLTFDCLLCGAKLTTKARLNEHIDRHTRPEVILRIPKTTETGRKKRKDENSMKYATALKLAGIVQQDAEQFVDSNSNKEDQDLFT